MGKNRSAKRALARLNGSEGARVIAGSLDAAELCRRIDFLEQMRPKNRNKPRNVRRLQDYRAALVAC